ncbi:hypothetical protein PFISCL1PPCAC_1785, partial [Pristionchus fissidentatus]
LNLSLTIYFHPGFLLRYRVYSEFLPIFSVFSMVASSIPNGYNDKPTEATTYEDQNGTETQINSVGAGGKRGSRFDSKRDSLPNGIQKRRLTSVSLASLALSQNIRGSTIHEDIEDEFTKDEKEPEEKANLDDRQSPWLSLWIGNLCQLMCGIQFSIYMMSMWPYLSKLDETADLTFLGWIIAGYSVGQAVASPLFGIWNQRTMSTKYPVALGLVFCIIGNLIYGILPTFTDGVKWIMLVARFIIGFGSGNYAVLRSYTASASVPRDRTRAIALATGSYVLGISFGPAIQMIFTPIDEGFVVGGVVHFNMFTFPAYAMCIINLISLILLFTVFKEDYAGILSKSDRTGKEGEYFVLPKTDYIAVSVCIYMFFIQNCVSTMMETLSSPITMALYGFDDQQTVVASGIAQAVASIIEIFNNALLAFTRLGKVNPRYILLVGLAGFSFYHICILPYPFFTTPLVYVENTTDGLGCYYEWCKTVPQVPQPVYWAGYLIGIGFGFPFLANPTGTLFSEVIGPRNQGNLQGIMALFGSIARIIAPIVSTALFENTGYMWPMLAELSVLIVGFIVVFVFWKRLVPLKITPKTGKSLNYKNGTFYKL